MYNLKPIVDQNWVIDMEINFDSVFTSEFGSDGLGIYYLKDVDKKDVKDITYTYTR